MMRKLAALVLGAAALTAGHTRAVGPPTLDLDYRTAISLALEKNFRLKVEGFNPLIAQARLLARSGVFDPTAEVSLTYDQNRRDLRALDPGFESGIGLSPGADRFAETTGT